MFCRSNVYGWKQYHFECSNKIHFRKLAGNVKLLFEVTWKSLCPVQKKPRKIVSEVYGEEYKPKKNIGCEGPLRNQTSRAISISN